MFIYNPPVPYSGTDGYGPVKMTAVNEALKAGHNGEGVIVAIVDTGIDRHHEDLNENLWKNTDEIPGNGIDDDRNGFVDDVHGWNFSEGTNETDDDQGHGTHVAGIVAAEVSPDDPVTGVACKSKIMAVQVLSDQGWGRINDVVKGILYAAKNGAKVINLSLSGGYNRDIYDAIRVAQDQYGCLVVMAAGNSSAPKPDFPARFSWGCGIAVGATDQNGRFASYSNKAGGTLGPWKKLGVTSPTHLYYVTACGTQLSTGYTGRYTWMTGTSMATPYVAGLAAIIWSHHPEYTHQQVKELLCFGKLL